MILCQDQMLKDLEQYEKITKECDRLNVKRSRSLQDLNLLAKDRQSSLSMH